MATAETAATTASLNVQLDHMTEHDLLEVCQIEGLSDLSAWGWDAYHKELEVAPETVMLVARLDPPIEGIEIAGFIVARVIAGELHVNNGRNINGYISAWSCWKEPSCRRNSAARRWPTSKFALVIKPLRDFIVAVVLKR